MCGAKKKGNAVMRHRIARLSFLRLRQVGRPWQNPEFLFSLQLPRFA